MKVPALSYRNRRIWVVPLAVGLLLTAASTPVEHTTDTGNKSMTSAPPALWRQESLRRSPTMPPRKGEGGREPQNTAASVVDFIDMLAMTMSADDTSSTPSSVWRVEEYPDGSVTVVAPIRPRRDKIGQARQTSPREQRSFWHP